MRRLLPRVPQEHRARLLSAQRDHQVDRRGVDRVVRLDRGRVCWLEGTRARCSRTDPEEPPIEPAGDFRALVDGSSIVGFDLRGVARWLDGTPADRDEPELVRAFAGLERCWLEEHGTVSCDFAIGRRAPIPGRYVQLVELGRAVCALRVDGALICWGRWVHEYIEPAAMGPFVDIGGYDNTICGLALDRATLHCLSRTGYRRIDLTDQAPVRGLSGSGRFVQAANGEVFRVREQWLEPLTDEPSVAWQNPDVRCVCALAQRTCREALERPAAAATKVRRYERCKSLEASCTRIHEQAGRARPEAEGVLAFPDALQDALADADQPWPYACETDATEVELELPPER